MLVVRYIIRFVRYAFLALFVAVVSAGFLFYLPPVQSWLGGKVCGLVESSAGIPLKIEKLRIVFPLDLRLEGVDVGRRGIRVAHLTLRVGLSRLLEGRLSAEEFTVGGLEMQSGSLIEGMALDGRVGTLRVRAERWDLLRRTLLVNDLQLSDANVQLSLRDTAEAAPKEPSPPFLSKINLLKGVLRNVRFSLRMPEGGMRLASAVDTLLLRRASIDLANQVYKVGEASLQAPALAFALRTDSLPQDQPDSLSLSLERSRLEFHSAYADLQKARYSLARLGFASEEIAYRADGKKPAEGFDPNHLALASVALETDTLCMEGSCCEARITHLAARDRSGLQLSSLAGSLSYRDTVGIVADVVLETPHSRIRLNGGLRSYLWSGQGDDGESAASYDIRVGYRDLRLLSSLFLGMPGRDFPARDLLLGGRVAGRGRSLTVQKTTVLLPGVLSLSLRGTYDFGKEALQAALQAGGEDLDLLVPWMTGQPAAGKAEGPALRFPEGLQLKADVSGRKSLYRVAAELADEPGKVLLEGNYDTRSERYAATLTLDSLQVNDFYPLDSVEDVSAVLSLQGRGTDIYSPRTRMEAGFSLERIGFRHGQLRFIRSALRLEKNRLDASLNADNLLLKMDAQLGAELRRNKPLLADLSMNVWDADLKAVGLVQKQPDQPFGVSLEAHLGEEITSIGLQTGDFTLFIDGKAHVFSLQEQVTDFIALLQKQLEARNPEHEVLKAHFPEAQIIFRAGENNIVNYILKERTSLSAKRINLHLKTSPETGISGQGYCYALQTGEDLTLDTLLFRAAQDSAGMAFYTTFINGPQNPAYSFRAQVNTLLSNHEGKMRIHMRDSEGRVGANLGLHGLMADDGYHISLYPAEPVIAFRKMRLNPDNGVWINQAGRVFANIQLEESGSGNTSIAIHSNDTVQAKQDLSFSIANLDMADVVRSLPFLPDIGGVLDATVSIRDEKRLRFLVNSRLREGSFNGMELGNLALRGGYMPDSSFDTHSVAAQLTRNEERVVSLGAKFRSESSELLSSLVTIHSLPLELFNGFVPGFKTYFTGTLEGKLQATGALDQPMLNGELYFDSSRVFVPAANLHLALDSQKIHVRDNVLHFHEYDIYASGKEPFRIDGTVSAKDFAEMPVADLTLQASNYQLINQRHRDKGTLLLGKLIVNLNSTVRGPLDRLQMRGNMRILGSTDLTYIMENSPLTVEDQLNEQLTFVDFSDTLAAANQTDSLASIVAYRPSSLDMMLQLTIDPTVHMRVELTKDGESYVDLEGGGSLTLQASPLNDLSLTGRYSLNNGTMKYAFPMIPLKEFALQPGSYVSWNGNLMNPSLHLTAVETIRSTVTDEDNRSRGVNFDISVNLTNTLENLSVSFDIAAPQDAAMQEELNALTMEERSKQAITTLAMGTYTGSSSGGSLKVNDALNSLLQSQINSLAGNVLKSTDLSIGMSSYSSDGSAEGGQNTTDYTYKFARRFWNNRIRVVIGGTITQGANATNRTESFIDNISIEYNINDAGTKSVRIYYNKNYESVLEGEIIKTGAGFVFRKKMYTLRELIPWYRYRRKETKEEEEDGKRN